MFFTAHTDETRNLHAMIYQIDMTDFRISVHKMNSNVLNKFLLGSSLGIDSVTCIKTDLVCKSSSDNIS